MERIAQNRSATLTQTFYVDGVATNPSPDAATVQITRADGTVLVAETAATEGGTGIVTYTLTPAQTALLDTLTVTWQATVGGQEQTYVDHVEVVGGFLFSIAEANAIKPSNATWTTAQIADKRTVAETTIEHECARAFVPRYSLETYNGTGTSEILLRHPDVRAIRSVTVDDVAYTQAQLDELAMNPTGLVYNAGLAFTLGASNVVIGYEHGMTYPPPRVAQAALILARSLLVRGPIDDRALGQVSGEFGFALSTPGRNGAWTGIPEVDAVIDQYGMRVGVA